MAAAAVTRFLHEAFFGFRSLFYLITPQETMYNNLKQVPNFVQSAIPIFLLMALIEIVICLKTKRNSTYSVSDTITSVGAGLLSRLGDLFGFSAYLWSYIYIYRNYSLYRLPSNSVPVWVLTFFLMDLSYYWFHRMAHEINILWAFHSPHHSSEYYNLSTALRQGFFQQYTSLFFYLPMALFISPTTFQVHVQLNLLYQFWIHTELIGKLGLLELFLNTPSHHRVHHGRNPYCIDKNYAGVLIIWDRLFGTFAAESDEKIQFGLVHNLNSFNQSYVQLGYPKYLLTNFFRKGSLANCIKFLLYGPGYNPKKPSFRLGDPKDIPQPNPAEKRFHKKMSIGHNVYVVIQFVLILILFFHMTEHHRYMTKLYATFGTFYFLLTLTSLGRILNDTPNAKLTEFGRIVIGSIFCFSLKTLTANLLAFAGFFSINGVLLLFVSTPQFEKSQRDFFQKQRELFEAQAAEANNPKSAEQPVAAADGEQAEDEVNFELEKKKDN